VLEFLTQVAKNQGVGSPDTTNSGSTVGPGWVTPPYLSRPSLQESSPIKTVAAAELCNSSIEQRVGQAAHHRADDKYLFGN